MPGKQGQLVMSEETLSGLPEASRRKIFQGLVDDNAIRSTMLTGNYSIAFKEGFDEYNHPCLDVFYIGSTQNLIQVRVGTAIKLKDLGSLLGEVSKRHSHGLPSQAYDVPNALKDGVFYMRLEDFREISHKVLGEDGIDAVFDRV